jgi:hypothetical protein
MKPIDYRNETWADVQTRLDGMLRATWEALAAHGPCTTRALAVASGMDILSVRPRVTDLCHMGMARLAAGTLHSKEGLYEAVPIAEAREIFERIRAQERGQLRQMNLPLAV